MIDPNYNNDADSSITIVTAFFDIGRGNWPKVVHGRVLPPYQHRGVDQYFEYFEYLAQMKNHMVIVTSPDLAERVALIRAKYNLSHRTDVIAINDPFGYAPEFLDRIQQVMDNPNFFNMVDTPHLPEYWNAKYVLINLLKATFVNVAIEEGCIKTPLAAWIDFGYCRTPATLPMSNNWDFPFSADKITLFNQFAGDFRGNLIDTLKPLIKTGQVYIQGCHIVGGLEAWKRLEELIFANVSAFLDNELIDDDQTFLLSAFISDPKLFNVLPADPNDWFRIFKEYNIRNHPEKIY